MNYLHFYISDWEAIVKLSDDFNGADLRNVCTEAGMFGVVFMVRLCGSIHNQTAIEIMASPIWKFLWSPQTSYIIGMQTSLCVCVIKYGSSALGSVSSHLQQTGKVV